MGITGTLSNRPPGIGCQQSEAMGRLSGASPDVRPSVPGGRKHCRGRWSGQPILWLMAATILSVYRAAHMESVPQTMVRTTKAVKGCM